MPTYQMDPLNSEVFKTAVSGDQTVNVGGYRDVGVLMEVLRNLPGAEQFFRQAPGGDDTSAAGVDPQRLAEYLQRTGYSIYDDPQGRKFSVMDGDRLLGEAAYTSPDTAFGIASSLLGAAGGNFLGAANGLGSIASGALSGGMAGGLNDPSLKSIATGAAVGGLMGGARDMFAPPVDMVKPIELPPGFSDVSNITNPIDAALARPIPQLDASGSLSQGLQSFGGTGTPWSYGGSGLDPNVLTGGGNALTGGYIPPQQGMPSLLGPISDATTGEPVRFETTGQRMPTDPTKGFAPMPEIGAQVPSMPTNAQAGITPGAPISLPSIPALAPIGGAGGSIIDKIIGNPLQAATIGAGLLAGSQEQGGGTATRTSQIDPRMAEALYGAGGFLPAAQDWYAQNKSGTNDTIKQGQQMQMGLLTDPRVNQQLEQMRTQSMGLLGRPVANNPFLRG